MTENADAARELLVAHDYDTDDRDLERLGIVLSRLPSDAGVVWRLTLPRGESREAWEPGNGGLAPPEELATLIRGAAGRKPLVPAPPLPVDAGARRLRDAIALQRDRLALHDPGLRLGEDPENLHQHRVAARRTRAFLRAARKQLDPDWRRSLSAELGELGQVTGPVRDLDVLLEHVREELPAVDKADAGGAAGLVAALETKRERARETLLTALDGDAYARLLARLRQPPRLREGADGIPLEQIAGAEVRRLLAEVRRLGKHPDVTSLHGLRIALKRARYAFELAGGESKRGRRVLAEARTLQGLLGEHQDAVVAEDVLRRTAVVDDRTAAAFVAGRLAERQACRRARVRAQLPRAWKRLRAAAG